MDALPLIEVDPIAYLKGNRAFARVPEVILPAPWLCEDAAAPRFARVTPRLVRASAAVVAPVPPLATGTAPDVLPRPNALRAAATVF